MEYLHIPSILFFDTLNQFLHKHYPFLQSVSTCFEIYNTLPDICTLLSKSEILLTHIKFQTINILFNNEHITNEFIHLLIVELRDYYYSSVIRTSIPNQINQRAVAWNGYRQVRWITTNSGAIVPPLPSAIPNFHRLHIPYQPFLPPLCFAVLLNNIEYIQHYFQSYSFEQQVQEINQLYDIGTKQGKWTLLHFAILADHINMITLLLDNGADPNLGSVMILMDGHYTVTPVGFAILLYRFEIVKLLLDSYNGKIGNSYVAHPPYISTPRTSMSYSTDNNNRAIMETNSLPAPSHLSSSSSITLSWYIPYIFLTASESLYKINPIQIENNLHSWFTNKELNTCLTDSCTEPCIHTQTYYHHYRLFHRYPIIQSHLLNNSMDNHVPRMNNNNLTTTPPITVTVAKHKLSKLDPIYKWLQIFGYKIRYSTISYESFITLRNTLFTLVINHAIYHEQANLADIFTEPLLERIGNCNDESLITLVHDWLRIYYITFPNIFPQQQYNYFTAVFHSCNKRVKTILEYHQQISKIIQLPSSLSSAELYRPFFRNSRSSILLSSSFGQRDDYIVSLPPINNKIMNTIFINILQKLFNQHHALLYSITDIHSKVTILSSVVKLVHKELIQWFNNEAVVGKPNQSSMVESPLLPSDTMIQLSNADTSYFSYFFMMLTELITVLRIGTSSLYKGAQIIQIQFDNSSSSIVYPLINIVANIHPTIPLSVSMEEKELHLHYYHQKQLQDTQKQPFKVWNSITNQYELVSKVLLSSISRTYILNLLPSIEDYPIAKEIFRYWIGMRAWKQRKFLVLNYCGK